MSKSYFIKRKICQCCKSENHKEIYSCSFLDSPLKEYLDSFYSPQGGIEFEYLKGVQYILDECQNCGMIYQREIPNEFLMKKLYDEWINPDIVFNNHKEKDDLNVYARYAHEIMTIIGYLHKIPSNLDFLDFGMGWGKWCFMAKAFGCNAFGIELSKSRIKHAQSSGINVLSWDDLPEYKFDLINAEQVFEHILDPLDTLIYLKQSLKPEGLIKINVPDGSGIKNRLYKVDWSKGNESRRNTGPISPLEHINCFNRKSIIKMAEIAGLVPVRIPLSIQYIYSTNWKPVKEMLKRILIPIYRDILQRGTYLVLKHK